MGNSRGHSKNAFRQAPEASQKKCCGLIRFPGNIFNNLNSIVEAYTYLMNPWIARMLLLAHGNLFLRSRLSGLAALNRSAGFSGSHSSGGELRTLSLFRFWLVSSDRGPSSVDGGIQHEINRARRSPVPTQKQPSTATLELADRRPFVRTEER